MNKFYVYILRRPDDHDPFYKWKAGPFYVGKGKEDRSKQHLYVRLRDKYKNRHKTNIIEYLKLKGLIVEIETLYNSLSEEKSFEIEKRLAQLYGRENNGTGILTNLTDGGDGPSGMIHSIESRSKISRSVSGKNNPFYGKKHTEETKRKMKTNHADFSGENHPLFGKRHPNFGRRYSEQEKMCRKKRPKGADHPLFGIPSSPEHLHNSTQALRSFYRNKRLFESGHENWFRCAYCKKYDDMINMYVSPNSGRIKAYHRECCNIYVRNKRQAKKLANSLVDKSTGKIVRLDATMKLGYCYKCDTVIIPNPEDVCGCGNIAGKYVNDTDCAFVVKDNTQCEVVGINSHLLRLFKTNEEKINVVNKLARIRFINDYDPEIKLQLVWTKPWSQAEDMGCEEGYRGYYYK